jgi:hypothetical protein
MNTSFWMRQLGGVVGIATLIGLAHAMARLAGS